MYETKIAKLKEIPVFSLSDVSQIVSGKDYAKKILKKMNLRKEILKIRRDCYSFYDDPFLISTFLIKPSYISSASALSYHKLISQIPKDIYCLTIKRNSTIKFNGEIKFIHTKYFFGFEKANYEGFSLPIANPEKAIIDSLGLIPVSIFEEAIEKINIEKTLSYLNKIKKSSILKRMGFLLERNNFQVYEKLKKGINRRYIYLDPLAKKSGKKDRKWGLIINA